MLPAIGQGVIAVVARKLDMVRWTAASCASHMPTASALEAERSLLLALDGDCRSPIAGLAIVRDGTIRLEAEILTHDGTRRIRGRRCGALGEAAHIGRILAAELLECAGSGFWGPRA